MGSIDCPQGEQPCDLPVIGTAEAVPQMVQLGMWFLRSLESDSSHCTFLDFRLDLKVSSHLPSHHRPIAADVEPPDRKGDIAGTF